jgi:1-aminocyclopropane-1-carboxylate deaminase/D-cysteine desulfhydrase-like pyridoxal-dependent ACC family enzyme
MTNNDYLLERFPTLGERLPRMRLASLPTPVREVAATLDSGNRNISVKCDDLTGVIYGGNKLRKLEYIFPRAREKECLRLATFGAVGSNSALATALFARHAGFTCTCFLMHQAKTAQIPVTLNMHIQNGTELIRYGGPYHKRVQTLRDNLWGRKAWVIPMGGSSWRGTVGFVAARDSKTGQDLCRHRDHGDGDRHLAGPRDRGSRYRGACGTCFRYRDH